MTRAVTLWGYAMLAAAAVACQTAALVSRRTATLGQALTRLKRRPAARVLLLAGWLWLGWHTFVRATYD